MTGCVPRVSSRSQYVVLCAKQISRVVSARMFKNSVCTDDHSASYAVLMFTAMPSLQLPRSTVIARSRSTPRTHDSCVGSAVGCVVGSGEGGVVGVAVVGSGVGGFVGSGVGGFVGSGVGRLDGSGVNVGAGVGSGVGVEPAATVRWTRSITAARGAGARALEIELIRGLVHARRVPQAWQASESIVSGVLGWLPAWRGRGPFRAR